MVSVTWLWIILAFLAGALFWYRAGGWMVRKAFRSTEYRRRVINNLSDSALIKVERDISEELLRRQADLDERKLKVSS